MPPKKNQHYVPRFLLKQFSKDARHVALFLLGKRQFVPVAKLANQCCAPYYYGKDLTVEDALSRAEGGWARIIRNLRHEKLESLGDEALDQLRLFCHYQRQRTPMASEFTKRFIGGFAEQALRTDPLGRFNPILDKVRIEPKEAELLTLKFAHETFGATLDLDVKFLVTNKRLGFVLSDEPVATYNQFLEHHRVLRDFPYSGSGLAAVGLQWFLPVSPDICVCIYDAGMYQYGPRNSRVCLAGISDIRAVNALQAASATQCIYIDPERTPFQEFSRLTKARERSTGWKEPSFVVQEATPRPGGGTSQIVAGKAPDLRLGLKFGFVQVLHPDSYSEWHRGAAPWREKAHAVLELADAFRRGNTRRSKD